MRMLVDHKAQLGYKTVERVIVLEKTGMSFIDPAMSWHHEAIKVRVCQLYDR